MKRIKVSISEGNSNSISLEIDSFNRSLLTNMRLISTILQADENKINYFNYYEVLKLKAEKINLSVDELINVLIFDLHELCENKDKPYFSELANLIKTNYDKSKLERLKK